MDHRRAVLRHVAATLSSIKRHDVDALIAAPSDDESLVDSRTQSLSPLLKYLRYAQAASMEWFQTSSYAHDVVPEFIRVNRNA